MKVFYAVSIPMTFTGDKKVKYYKVSVKAFNRRASGFRYRLRRARRE